MSRLPRLGMGVVEASTDPTPMLWGLLAALDRRGLVAQQFHSRAHFQSHDGATAITGFAPRHLDSWLMGDQQCRQAFLRGMRRAEIAIVDGVFAARPPAPRGGDSDNHEAGYGRKERGSGPRGGALDDLCGWLNLPRVAIIDVARWDDCHLPPCPPALDGVLLDGVRDERDYCRLRTHFESFWGTPVLGAMEAAPALRAAIGRLAFGAGPPREVSERLATAVERFTDFERLLHVATKHEFPFRGLDDAQQRGEQSDLRIAMACDEAFRCYFPDTLELLELRGATICDFSPLKDERLPPETDIVYFGCGRPDQFADALMANSCMVSALREHLCNGQRIYAECGGLAYLSRQIEYPDGRRAPMAGVLPVTAKLGAVEPPRPYEARLHADCWLGRKGDWLRGYLNPRWTISGADRTGASPPPSESPAGELSPDEASPEEAAAPAHGESLASVDEGRSVAHGSLWNPALIARHQAIGSRLHLDFAAQTGALEAFFHPHAAMMDVDSPALARAL